MRTITRSEWGARYPDGCGPAPVPASRLYLHHSVTAAPPADATLAQDIAAVRALEAIGQGRFGCGISYTKIFLPSGRIFQGHNDNRQGTHTGGLNNVARAFCLVGNYEVLYPTPMQIQSVRWALEDSHRRGVTPRWLTGGHYLVKSTACPGRNAIAAIPRFNQPYSPTPIPTPVEDDVDSQDKIDIANLVYNRFTVTDEHGKELSIIGALEDQQRELAAIRDSLAALTAGGNA
ncbi:MAG: N-acetylmuramoyl-L-alanine amidase [Chloroflexi bacterium]|nr:N-acetylmuramoyl-L-alanine amidase [Chloroflexota bacterium]